MRTLQRIIVGHDLQPGGDLVVRSATELAKRCGAQIKLVHVVEPSMSLISPQEIESEWQAFFADLPPLVDVNSEYSTGEGEAISAISETAEKHEADLIIMGRHGRTGSGHMLLGSVAEGVVRQAPYSVLTIRPDAVQFSLP